tara:strand:- start:13 stop:639 length:627 start_codon:yes stop_codon:yes gene_type:complete
MPSHFQGTVLPDGATSNQGNSGISSSSTSETQLSRSNNSSLQESFSGSPFLGAETETIMGEIREKFAEVLTMQINGNSDFPNFDPNYTGKGANSAGMRGKGFGSRHFSPPVYGELIWSVDSEYPGLPANSFVPNIHSTTELGSIDPSNMGPPSATNKADAKTGSAPFSGLGTDLDPKSSSDNIAGQSRKYLRLDTTPILGKSNSTPSD